jgi:cell pole-organizing protein PopZ
VVERGGIDEIIVSTLPSRLSRWLHQDLPHKVERRVDIPVSVVTATDTEAIAR